MTYLHCSYTAPTCVYILVFMRGCGSFVYLTASSTETGIPENTQFLPHKCRNIQ